MTCSTCLLASGYSQDYFQENFPSVNVLFIAFDLFFFNSRISRIFYSKSLLILNYNCVIIVGEPIIYYGWKNDYPSLLFWTKPENESYGGNVWNR